MLSTILIIILILLLIGALPLLSRRHLRPHPDHHHHPGADRTNLKSTSAIAARF